MSPFQALGVSISMCNILMAGRIVFDGPTVEQQTIVDAMMLFTVIGLICIRFRIGE